MNSGKWTTNSNAIQKTTLHLYRDCLRLVKHIAGTGPKSNTIKITIRKEFENHRHVTDPIKIEELKSGAIRGLSNYLVYSSAAKDKRIKKAMELNDNNDSCTPLPPLV